MSTTAAIDESPNVAISGSQTSENANPSGDDDGPDDGYINVPRGQRGGKKIPHRPSQLEMEQRVQEARDMLLDGAKFGDVRKTIAEKYGVQPRSIDRYVKQARDELMMESGKSREEWRALNIERYLLIYRTPGTRALDRIKALERIDKLLGLEVTAPRQVQLTGADGGPIKSETSATVVVAGVDLGGRLKEVGAKVRAAALQTLLEAVQADPAALAAPAIEIEAVPVESPAAVQAESEQV